MHPAFRHLRGLQSFELVHASRIRRHYRCVLLVVVLGASLEDLAVSAELVLLRLRPLFAMLTSIVARSHSRLNGGNLRYRTILLRPR